MKIDIVRWMRAHKTEIYIFIAAFVVRAIYALIVQMHAGADGFIAFSDAKFFYYREALNLLTGNGFSIASEAPYYPGSYHTPVYPLFVATLLFLRVPLLGVVLVQQGIAAGICVLFYRTLLKITESRTIALIAGAIACVEPMSIYWSGLLMSDTVFAFFMVLSFYFLANKRPVATAFSLGLAALTRPIALYFAPVFLVFVAYQTFAMTKNLRTAGLNTVLVAVLFAAVISPWFVRNYVVFDTWQFSSASWYNIYITNMRSFSHDYATVQPEVEQPDRLNTDFQRYNFDYLPAYKAAVLSQIKQNIPGYAVFEIKRTARAMFSSKYQYIPNQLIRSEFPWVFQHYRGSLMFLVAVGDLLWIVAYALVAVAFWNRRLRPWWFFFVALIGINAVLSGMINPWGPDMTRYSIPFQGFVFSFACLGASMLWGESHAKQQKKRFILR